MTIWTMVAAVGMVMWAISLAIGLAWISTPAPRRAKTVQGRPGPECAPRTWFV